MGNQPLFRGQGNTLFKTNAAVSAAKRGQTVPYDVNGSPTSKPSSLVINLNDLPVATPTKPLFEFKTPSGGIVFNGSNDLAAGVAATAASALRYFRNGVANGTLTFTGTAGVSSFSDSTYVAGDLFSLYPPTSVDATLDRVRITLGTN